MQVLKTVNCTGINLYFMFELPLPIAVLISYVILLYESKDKLP